jgi:hypothetical protein
MALNKAGLTPREAAIDALTRFVCSLDEGDPVLLKSSITADMLMDLSPFNAAGFNYSPFSGQDVVCDRLMAAVGVSMDTTHSITNFRTKMIGEGEMQVKCYVLAQHFRLGQGQSSDFQDYYLMGNKYSAVVVRGDADEDGSGEWKIKELVITPAWTQGVSAVMKV